MSRGGARGDRTPLLILGKKEEMTEGRKACRGNKTKPGPQGLNPLFNM